MVTAYPETVKEFLVYTALRIVLLLTSLAVVGGVWTLVTGGVDPLLVVVVSFVVSGLASYFLLDRQREAFARRVDERAHRVSARIEQARSREDTD